MWELKPNTLVKVLILWSVCQHYVSLLSDSVSLHRVSLFRTAAALISHFSFFVLVGLVGIKVWSCQNISHWPDIYRSGCVARRQDDLTLCVLKSLRGREGVQISHCGQRCQKNKTKVGFLSSGEKQRCSHFQQNCKKTTGKKNVERRERKMCDCAFTLKNRVKTPVQWMFAASRLRENWVFVIVIY